MFQRNKILVGFVICAACWLVGFYMGFDKAIIDRSMEKKVFLNDNTTDIITCVEVFFTILSNNLAVAFILAFLGYFSFGLVSIFVSIYNGFILSLHITSFLNTYTVYSLYKVLLHAPTEFFSLCYFGAFGITGFSNFLSVINEEKYSHYNFLTSLKILYLPIFLLFFSALIESDLYLKLIN